MVADILLFAGGRHPAVMRPAPRRGKVDLRLGVDQWEGLGKVPCQDGDGVPGFLELEGAGETNYSGPFW